MSKIPTISYNLVVALGTAGIALCAGTIETRPASAALLNFNFQTAYRGTGSFTLDTAVPSRCNNNGCDFSSPTRISFSGDPLPLLDPFNLPFTYKTIGNNGIDFITGQPGVSTDLSRTELKLVFNQPIISIDNGQGLFSTSPQDYTLVPSNSSLSAKIFDIFNRSEQVVALNVTAVPEPNVVPGLVLSGVGMGLLVLKRKKQGESNLQKP